MTQGVLIITEANQKVASGHLFECIVCQDELTKRGIENMLMINSDMQQLLKERIKGKYVEYLSNIQEEDEFIQSFLQKNSYDVILFNLREITNDFLEKVKTYTKARIIVIDEFGHRKLNPDTIINPMIDEYYWNYDTEAKIFCGAEYLILSPKLSKYHEQDKDIKDEINTITVSMGGVDLPGTTLKIARWLMEMDDFEQINLILGGGFLYREELEKLILHNNKFRIYQNIANIYQLFQESDLVFCAGGNTLHELAAIGTPTIVIPSMPHEVRNGRAFEGKGFGQVCKETDNLNKAEVINKLIRLKDKNIRINMKKNGKRISDGKGNERVINVICE